MLKDYQVMMNLAEKSLQNNWSFCVRGTAQVATWAVGRNYVNRLALENVLDVLDDTIGQRHDGQVVGVIPKGVFDLQTNLFDTHQGIDEEGHDHQSHIAKLGNQDEGQSDEIDPHEHLELVHISEGQRCLTNSPQGMRSRLQIGN